MVAGTADAVLMVESEAKELSEDVMLGAVVYGQKHFQPVLDAIVKLAERAAKEPWELKPKDDGKIVAAACAAWPRPSCARPMRIAAKHERRDRVAAIKEKVIAALVPADDDGTVAPKVGDAPSRKRRRTWSARASSTPSSASTGAT